MTAMRWSAALVAAFVLFTAAPASAGNQEVRVIDLFKGSNTSAAVDTVEQASPWFSVRGAFRIYIRTWSANTSAWTAADSIYADSITTFKVLLSDSICCVVTGPNGQTLMSAADSVMYDVTLAQSTSDSMLWAKSLPVNKPLAAAKNGSGVMSVIEVPTPGLAGNAASFTDVVAKQFMRVRWQPLRRNTEGGRLSTTGKRTVGIRGLRMQALVVYANE